MSGPSSLRTLFASLLLGAALGCGSEPADEASLVARAGPYELSIDDATALLVDEEGLPAQARVVEALADVWIDYVLLAAAVEDDSTFSDLDFAPLVDPRIEQSMVLMLRDSVIQVDTFVTDDELRALYEADAPAMEIRARHIVLSPPPQATQAQRDSVRERLVALRDSILGGTPFEEIARRHSQDPGTARTGGDLGFFGRGDMVAPFEEAVLSLEPGEVSDVVQTPMGLHLIRVEERRAQPYDEVADAFRSQVLAQRSVAAESTFIAALEARVEPELQDGAVEVVRELARTPQSRLSGRAARRALVAWDGGEFSAGEFLDLIRGEQPALREDLQQRSDEELRNLLIGQSRRELLVEEARSAGLETPQERVDSMEAGVRSQLREAARRLGLRPLDAAPGEPMDQAVERAARVALARNLTGATQILPLGAIGFQLREGVPTAVYDAGVGQVLLRVAQARASRGPSALEQAPAAPPPDTVP